MHGSDEDLSTGLHSEPGAPHQPTESPPSPINDTSRTMFGTSGGSLCPSSPEVRAVCEVPVRQSSSACSSPVRAGRPAQYRGTQSSRRQSPANAECRLIGVRAMRMEMDSPAAGQIIVHRGGFSNPASQMAARPRPALRFLTALTVCDQALVLGAALRPRGGTQQPRIKFHWGLGQNSGALATHPRIALAAVAKHSADRLLAPLVHSSKRSTLHG